MKTHILILLFVVIVLPGCEKEEVKAEVPQLTQARMPDTTPPVIMLYGKKIDTTYLQFAGNDTKLTDANGYPKWQPCGREYMGIDPADKAVDNVDGDITPFIQITGKVNKKIPGIYQLHYNASDAAGNPAATVTRTVYVMDNSAHFLNGSYNVVCTCTTAIAGSRSPTITTGNYTTNVTTSSEVNNQFNVSILDIGSESSSLSSILKGNSINVSFLFSPAEYHPNSCASGTLSASKNTFTIDTKICRWSPLVTYTCKNICTKQLIEIARDDK